MKILSLLLISLLPLATMADIGTAFLVVRADIEDEIIQIDAHGDLDKSLKALQGSLTKLELHKDKIFAPAIASRLEGEPLDGLTLTRVHSYLKIHLTILERGLALAEAAERIDNSSIDEQSVAAMSLSLLTHYNTYLKDDHLRILLSKKDEAYDLKRKALKKAYARLTNRKIQKLIGQAIGDGHLSKQQIEHFAENNSLWKKSRKAFRGDFWSNLKTFVVHHISGGFGNAAGAVKFRKGTMWQDYQLETTIQEMLEPMDIITERTPFILTDRLIPGHFGHNALWLGTREQLIELGIWDAEYMKPYQEAILDGFNIMETDRSGTHLKRLSDWMNIDEIAVVRRSDRARSPQQVNEFYAVLMAQYGKTYDFNFDVETTDKLVCSELLYQTYGDVTWPTHSYLGRFTITPDNVAEIITQKNTPFKLIYSLERPEDSDEIKKDIVQLSKNLGYTFNGVDEDGQKILEKESRTCIDSFNAEGTKFKTCIKTWLRPVFGGQTLRRYEH